MKKYTDVFTNMVNIRLNQVLEKESKAGKTIDRKYLLKLKKEKLAKYKKAHKRTKLKPSQQKALMMADIDKVVFKSLKKALRSQINNLQSMPPKIKQAVTLLIELRTLQYLSSFKAVNTASDFKLGGKRLFATGKAPAQVDLMSGSIAFAASTQTAAELVASGLMGAVNEKTTKEQKKIIKDKSDGLAKRIYDKVIKKQGIAVAIGMSEGFGRDGVKESFRAAEVINAEKRKNGIESAFIDVIEGTNPFVTNNYHLPMDKISNFESGGTSAIVIGDGVKSLGNAPDIYADVLFTRVNPKKLKEFKRKPLNPDVPVKQPYKKIKETLQRIAKANKIKIRNMEIVLMDREREGARLEALRKIKKRNPGMKITLIKDGTVAHGLQATFGRKNGKHKVLWTVGACPEGFINLASAKPFQKVGAVAGLRIYSKNVNDSKKGDAKDLAWRYNFGAEEKKLLRKLRPKDASKILSGKKLFTLDDAKGSTEGAFSFITDNGVFRQPGVRKLAKGLYRVRTLRCGDVNGEAHVWVEEKNVNVGGRYDKLSELLLAGGELFDFLRNNKRATIAANIISPLQLDGHFLAAMKTNSILILESALSQGGETGYGMTWKQQRKMLKESIERTGFNLPFVWHLDHHQVNIKNYKKDAKKEIRRLKKEIYDFIEAGGTSIAIDASTAFNDKGVQRLLDREGIKLDRYLKTSQQAMEKGADHISPKIIPLALQERIAKTGLSENIKITKELAHYIKKLIERKKPELVGRFGLEVEAGHIDFKVEVDGKTAPKLTTPIEIRVMLEALKKDNIYPDTIAFNNGSGHGTSYDEFSNVIPQKGQLRVPLTNKIAQTSKPFGVSPAQHGTSGSSLEELGRIQKAGTIKFNVATNFHEIEFNIYAMIRQGMSPAEILSIAEKNKARLVQEQPHLKELRKIIYNKVYKGKA